MVAKCLLRTRGNKFDAMQLATAEGAPARVINYLKSAVGAEATGNAEALVDVAVVNRAFFESLAHQSVFYNLLTTGFVRLPMRTKISLTTAQATGYEVGAGNPVPVTRIEVDPSTFVPRKAAALVVVTDELADATSPVAQALINKELRKAVIRAVDDALFTAIRDSAATEIPSSGMSAADAAYDLRALFTAVPSHTDARHFLIASPNVAKRASTLTTASESFLFPAMGPKGGEMVNTMVLVSDSVAADELWLIDGSGIAAGGEDLQFDSARQATIEMDNQPANDSVVPTPAPTMGKFVAD